MRPLKTTRKGHPSAVAACANWRPAWFREAVIGWSKLFNWSWLQSWLVWFWGQTLFSAALFPILCARKFILCARIHASLYLTIRRTTHTKIPMHARPDFLTQEHFFNSIQRHASESFGMHENSRVVTLRWNHGTFCLAFLGFCAFFWSACCAWSTLDLFDLTREYSLTGVRRGFQWGWNSDIARLMRRWSTPWNQTIAISCQAISTAAPSFASRVPWAANKSNDNWIRCFGTKKHADRRLLFLLDLHLIQASRS